MRVGWLAAFLGLLPLIAEAQSTGYLPVAPPAAMNATVRANVKQVRSWVADKDYQSAAEATRGLALAVQLYGCQSPAADWRKQIASLQETIAKLDAAVKKKSAADCTQALADCDRLLDNLAKAAPEKAADKNFKGFGSTKTWMTLMEGTYIDAKRAESAQELAQFSFALAEEANALAHLTGKGGWRDASIEVREAALKAAKAAGANDVPEARKALKVMYQRCEACHQGSKR